MYRQKHATDCNHHLKFMDRTSSLWIATKNPGKLKEFQALFSPLKVYSLKDLNQNIIIEESGCSYFENASIKALALKKILPDQWILGEDSGLEVTCLGGAPGIRSARFSGQNATDLENNRYLLEQLRLSCRLGHDLHPAQFTACIVSLSPQGEKKSFKACLLGGIKNTYPVVATTAGFGYDPLFSPLGQENKSISELGEKWKRLTSHRAKASKKWLKYFRKHPSNQ